MKTGEALLSARSYITILLGFLLGFAIVVWVERQMPTRVESSAGMTLSENFPPLPAPRELTFNEAVWARVAWQYFVNNTQPNGLANAHDGAPWLNLWSTGSYLFAALAARQLDVITQAEFDERITAALFALGQLPLNAQGLPAAYYHADTLTILGKPDSSAIGMGRLLMALETLLWRYPGHAAEVRDLFSQWQTGALITTGATTRDSLPVRHWTLATDEPRNSFGYRLYASHTLRLIDSAAGLAVTNPPEGQQMMDIDGIMVPDEGLRTPWGRQPSLVSLPYLLTGLERGFDAQSGEIAWRIMQIQQRRHSLRVRKPPISTDYAEPAPDYTRDRPNQPPVNEPLLSDMPPEQRAITSTRSAFAWYALFRNEWSEALRQQVQALQVPGKGWQRGLNLNNSTNNVIDADTNAVVLESLSFIAHGQLLCLACLNDTPPRPSSLAGATP
ncbi:DUF3131 domain-containing protein [Franconibacter sp. IITDAS19]|uniref:DUF3131 domain-containing protein n=1 Tax=Franconibacter pulveris TaxID=435910 RepID=A0A0J8VV79_9ENTR|nr:MULTISPECIES: DUF3131 domain-containing protein [Franconibacter]KMV36390.1 hypothetical protein ACH50_02980 [Franconibacter pulveris]MCK1966923.1 DUF3131 domain-containing protein [Franconibacter sp. IITDAS19]